MSFSVKVIDSTKKILDAPEGSTLAFLCGSYGWQQHDTFRILNAIDPYLAVQFNTFAISWEPDYGNYEHIKA